MRRPSLADFIEDELLRAPLLFDAVLDAVYEQWRQSMSVAGRAGGELARVLQQRRGEVTAAALGALRQAATTPPVPAVPAGAAHKTALSLVDEKDVVADLEIGRCAEHIKSEAEAELRETHAYTSALVGDIAVSRDTNPFRPEHFARAFWDGCHVLPAPPQARLDAFHRGILPLARCVRSALAAACARLAAQGIVPATYRTLVFPPVHGTQMPERVHFPPEDLTTLRDSMIGTLDPRTRATAGACAAPAADAQLARLMGRLFDEIRAEGGVPEPVVKLLAELRPAFERIAPHDEGMIDSFDHPVWQFIDRLAFTAATTPPAEQNRLVGLARNLIAHLSADPAPDASRFAWAEGRLEGHDRQSLALATHVAAEEIQRLARALPVAATRADAGIQPLALDVGTLDTVPDEMRETPTAPGADSLPIGRTAPGDRLRVFLQGEWRSLQLLWSRDDLWLLRDLAGGRHWALRPGVIERLAAEHLVKPLRMRSLVRRAAERVQLSL